MARLKTRGLQKTVGVPGLFATAYGNVGSSIYYALGLVAAHALGLTPVVFLFAGGLFALTAKTYAEGAAMFPEAGGSSSFARHAFNEVVSFIAGWGLSLDYILTIAISAFFVPHYLAVFFPALGHAPGDVIGGIATIGLLALVNIRGLGESANLNIFLALLDLFTQIALVGLGCALVLHPATLVNQVHFGTAPSLSQLIFAVSISMLAYTGIETVSNMAEEARDPGEQVPKAVNLVLIAVLGIYAGISVVALSALPVHEISPGHYATQLGTTYSEDRLGAPPARLAGDLLPLLRRRPRRDDPLHRHQRGNDRHLAALLVARRAPPAARRLRPPAPQVPHALVHDPLLLGDRGDPRATRQHDLPRQSLQLRGDALVHDRPPLDHRPAPPRARPLPPL
jgi:APA family basic amino acid/polyamine antiporter